MKIYFDPSVISYLHELVFMTIKLGKVKNKNYKRLLTLLAPPRDYIELSRKDRFNLMALLENCLLVLDKQEEPYAKQIEAVILHIKEKL